jgi:hypothetical protein
VIWHVGSTFANSEGSRPAWHGFMQSTCNETYFPPATDIRFLPMIDRSLTDTITTYSALCYVQEQARKLKSIPAVVTFDQPFLLKAIEIVLSREINIVEWVASLVDELLTRHWCCHGWVWFTGNFFSTAMGQMQCNTS